MVGMSRPLYLIGINANFEYIAELDDLASQSMSLVVDETGQRLWSCDLCGKTNKDKYKVRRHMETHLKLQHPCPHCDKHPPNREALRLHIARHHKY